MKKLLLISLTAVLMLVGCGKKTIEGTSADKITVEGFGDIIISEIEYHSLVSYSNDLKEYEMVSYYIKIDYNEDIEKINTEDIYFENIEDNKEIIPISDIPGYAEHKDHFKYYNGLEFKGFFSPRVGSGRVYHILPKGEGILDFYKNHNLVFETPKDYVKVSIDTDSATKYDDSNYTNTMPHTMSVGDRYELTVDHSYEFITTHDGTPEYAFGFEDYSQYFRINIKNTSGKEIENFNNYGPHFDILSIHKDGFVMNHGMAYYDVYPSYNIKEDASIEILLMLNVGHELDMVKGFIVTFSNPKTSNEEFHVILIDK